VIRAGDVPDHVDFTATATGSGPAPPPSCAAGTGTDHGSRIIASSETWRLSGSPHHGTNVEVRDGAVLTIEPGVTACVHQLIVRDTGRLVAEGTALQPIAFSIANRNPGQWNAMVLLATSTSPSGPSLLKHAALEGALFVVDDDYPVSIQDSRFFQFDATVNPCPTFSIQTRSLRGRPAASEVLRTVFDGYGCPGNPAVLLSIGEQPAGCPMQFQSRVLRSPGVGIQIASAGSVPTVALVGCEVAASGEHGVVLGASVAAGETIAGCNFSGNAGNAVENQSLTSVSARGNWWGDPAGPAGPSGDGVSANVDASAPLAAAVVLGY